MIKTPIKILFFVLLVMLYGCQIGPKYIKPTMCVPSKLKEAPSGWKYAEPQDIKPICAWWTVFNDDCLNALEDRINVSNQNVLQLAAQYDAALDTISKTKATYWPTISVTASDTRTKLSDTTVGGVTSRATLFSTYLAEANATWYPDVFGAIRLAVAVNKAGAEATAAQLAFTQLSMQALLAQNYMQLRAIDVNQKFLDDTVNAYKNTLKLTKNNYNAGTVSDLDVTQAEAQLFAAQTTAVDNGILRAQYEHAIAVLIGEFPENFSLPVKATIPEVPNIPLEVPSTILERRPDIAQAERLMAQANAQIGVAVAAYYPLVTLTGMDGFSTGLFRKLFLSRSHAWSLGASLVETIFDGGSRDASVAIARDNYCASVAAYKQTVLSAMQNVEDNLVALRKLDTEVVLQKAAVESAEKALKLTLNQYKAGTVAYSSVITAQIAAFTAEQTAIAITSRRLVASVNLIQALGGCHKYD